MMLHTFEATLQIAQPPLFPFYYLFLCDPTLVQLSDLVPGLCMYGVFHTFSFI